MLHELGSVFQSLLQQPLQWSFLQHMHWITAPFFTVFCYLFQEIEVSPRIEETKYLCTFLLEEVRLPITYLPEGDLPTSLLSVYDAPGPSVEAVIVFIAF